MREEHIGLYTLEKVFICRRIWDQTCIQVSNSIIGSDLDEKQLSYEVSVNQECAF